MLDSSKNPYVGLRPYLSNESLYFFGRETQTLELLQRLHNNNFVAIVGSSGCGKSSLLRAGLIPALKGGFLVEDSNKWEISIMKPGESPMYNLADALLKNNGKSANKNEITSFVNKIEDEGVDAILEHFVPLAKKSNINFFLLVDQFEELFAFTKKKPENLDKTINDSKNEAINFVNVLLELVDQKVLPFYVVFTMRSDFIGDCSEYHGLPEAMNKSQYLVPRLNRQQLKKVIEGPSKLTGKKFNASLTSKLLNNLGDSQDELPILQHALMRMWEYDENEDTTRKGLIDFSDYKSVGGLEKALANHAQDAIDNLSKEDRKIATTLFKSLTTIDGRNRKIRRQVRLSKLVEFTQTSEDKLLKIIKRFIEGGRSFLVIEDVGEFDDKLIDISHESLIRQWKALSELVIQEARDAKQYKALSEKQKEYSVGDRDLLEGIELEKAQHWWNTFNPGKTWAITYDANYDNCKYFLAASKKKYDQKKFKGKALKFGLPGILILLGVIAGFNYLSTETERLEIETARLETDLNNTDIVLWANAKEDNTILGFQDYLDKLPEGKNAQMAKEILKRKYDTLWITALKINTIKGFEDYLIEATKSVNDSDDGSIIPEYSAFATNVQDAVTKIKQGDLEEENNPWELAKAENTVTSYINYINGGEQNEGHYLEAVAKLKVVGKKGWLYCGRKNDGKTKIITDRVFDLVNRKGSYAVDDMLKEGDIVQLRGKAHRKIRASAEASSAGVGVVMDNTNYFVLSTIGDTAVFVQIIF